MKECDHKFIESTQCVKCGWSPSESIRVVDRRGEKKQETKPRGDPGYIQKIRRTGNPREFLAILPFNRVTDHYFTVTAKEDEGFRLGLHPPEKPTRKEKQAIEAARQRMRLVAAEARRFHRADVQLSAEPGPEKIPPSEVAEPEKVQ